MNMEETLNVCRICDRETEINIYFVEGGKAPKFNHRAARTVNISGENF